MFWHETQYKHAEEARQRNKREDRKLKIEIERKNGMRSVLKYQTDAVSKEQRRIKRELDKMRKSSIGPTNVFNKSPRRLQVNSFFRGKKASKRKIARVEPFDFFEKRNLQNDIAESVLMRSIMLINCEPNVKENNKMLKKGQFNDLTTRSDSSEQQNSLSSYDMTDMLSNNNNNSGSVYCDELSTVDRRSENTTSSNDNIYYFNSLSPVHLSSPVSLRQLNADLSEENDIVTDLRSERVVDSESESSLNSKRREKNLDLFQLANLDMKSVKSDVSRRLSGTKAPSKSELDRRRVSDGNVALAKPTSKVPPTRRRISEGQVQLSKSPNPPPVKVEEETTAVEDDAVSQVSSRRSTKDIIPTPLNYNPEYYNPDGSLRAKWTLPDPDTAWEAAKNARYIRTSDRRESEIELDVNEIFK